MCSKQYTNSKQLLPNSNPQEELGRDDHSALTVQFSPCRRPWGEGSFPQADPEVTKESSLTSPHFLTYILPYSYIYIPTLCNFYTISGAAWVTLVIHLRGAHTFGWLSRYTSDNLRVEIRFDPRRVILPRMLIQQWDIFLYLHWFSPFGCEDYQQ